MYYCANETNVDRRWRESSNYHFIKGNICSIDLVNHILNSYKVSHVIHFAAQSHVQNSFKYTQDNIVGTHTLLECCRLYGKLERFIHVSTDEVYGESMNETNEQHKTEHSILCPTNPLCCNKGGRRVDCTVIQSFFWNAYYYNKGNNV